MCQIFFGLELTIRNVGCKSVNELHFLRTVSEDSKNAECFAPLYGLGC